MDGPMVGEAGSWRCVASSLGGRSLAATISETFGGSLKSGTAYYMTPRMCCMQILDQKSVLLALALVLHLEMSSRTNFESLALALTLEG